MNQFISDITDNSGITSDRMQNHGAMQLTSTPAALPIRQRWDVSRIEALLDLPFSDLIHTRNWFTVSITMPIRCSCPH